MCARHLPTVWNKLSSMISTLKCIIILCQFTTSLCTFNVRLWTPDRGELNCNLTFVRLRSIGTKPKLNVIFFFLLIDWRCNKRWPDCHYAAMHLRQTIFSIEWRKICPLFCRFAKRGSSSISKSSDVNKRGPRGQWPPSSWIGPHLFGHGGHRGPHLWSQMASKWCFPANITKISLSPPALVHIIHWNFSRQKLQNSQILLRKSDQNH